MSKVGIVLRSNSCDAAQQGTNYCVVLHTTIGIEKKFLHAAGFEHKTSRLECACSTAVLQLLIKNSATLKPLESLQIRHLLPQMDFILFSSHSDSFEQLATIIDVALPPAAAINKLLSALIWESDSMRGRGTKSE